MKLRLPIVHSRLKSQDAVHVAIEVSDYEEGRRHQRNVVFGCEPAWKQGDWNGSNNVCFHTFLVAPALPNRN